MWRSVLRCDIYVDEMTNTRLNKLDRWFYISWTHHEYVDTIQIEQCWCHWMLMSLNPCRPLINNICNIDIQWLSLLGWYQSKPFRHLRCHPRCPLIYQRMKFHRCEIFIWVFSKWNQSVSYEIYLSKKFISWLPARFLGVYRYFVQRIEKDSVQTAWH